MTVRDTLIARAVDREGGYVNDPSDSGGETNYGVTVEVARRFGYRGHMRDLPISVAHEVYAALYWLPIKGDALAVVDERLAEKMLDASINCGTTQAARWLQRVLNVFNDRQRLTYDLAVDGVIGSRTLRALNDLARTRDVATIVKGLDCLQGAFYIELAERREKDERFVYGWLKHRVAL